jgi:hypothetical protein
MAQAPMNILQDLRFARRSLRSRFGTTAFATLALVGGMPPRSLN